MYTKRLFALTAVLVSATLSAGARAEQPPHQPRTDAATGTVSQPATSKPVAEPEKRNARRMIDKKQDTRRSLEDMRRRVSRN